MSKVKIIAECAQGFEGSLKLAKDLVTLAKHAESDIVKLQLIIADEICTPDYIHNSLFKNLELKYSEYVELFLLSKELEIELCFDVYGLKSLKICEDLGLDIIKIHPTDLNNIKLLENINHSNIKNVILGVGGALINEVDIALDHLQKKKIVLMLGHQAYPTPLEDNRITRLEELRRRYVDSPRVSIGFADHESSDSIYSQILPAMAVALGAKYIEKHLTTHKLLRLEDSETAFNPDEFIFFQKSIRAAESVLGNDNLPFELSDSEERYRKSIRRHVVASRNLKKGHKLTYLDLKLLRTSEVTPIHNLNECIGQKILRGITINEAITKDILE